MWKYIALILGIAKNLLDVYGLLRQQERRNKRESDNGKNHQNTCFQGNCYYYQRQDNCRYYWQFTIP